MLTNAKIEQAAEILYRARLDRRPIDGLPADAKPTSLAEAYDIQRAYDRRAGDPVVGYKIGAASVASQRLVGASGPFLARVHASRCIEAPAKVALQEFLLPAVEAEFAFELGEDLPPRDRLYHKKEVVDAIAAVRPIVEICDNRFRDWRSTALLEIIADSGFFGALVLGRRLTDWRRRGLGTVEVVIRLDGAERGRGRCESVLGDPIDGVVWMANELSRQSIGLKRGHIIPIGTWTGLHVVAQGTKVNADFGGMGTVDFEFG